MSFDQKTPQKSALVTGATSGIGFYLAKHLALNGFKVYALGRRVERMEPLKEFGVQVFQCDVTDSDKTQEIKSLIAKENEGTLDLLFHNAGFPYCAATIDFDPEKLKYAYDVNLLSPMRITKEFAPLVIKAKGTIAFSGSIFHFAAAPLLSAYCSSKAALLQYANCLDLELKPLRVKIIHVTIGAVNTDFSSSATLLPDEKALFNFHDGTNVNAEIESRVYSNKAKSTTPEDMALKLVNDLANKNTPFNVNRGRASTIASWLNMLLPRLVFQNILYKKYSWLDIIERFKRYHNFA